MESGLLRRETTTQPEFCQLFDASLDQRYRRTSNTAWRMAFVVTWITAWHWPLLRAYLEKSGFRHWVTDRLMRTDNYVTDPPGVVLGLHRMGTTTGKWRANFNHGDTLFHHGRVSICARVHKVRTLTYRHSGTAARGKEGTDQDHQAAYAESQAPPSPAWPDSS